MRYTLIENRISEPIPLSEIDLRYLQQFKYARDLVITPVAGGQTYKLTADNIVGAISLPSGIQIHIRPKIGLPNLFRLLSFVSNDYFGMDEMVDYEEEEGIFDLLGQLYSLELSKVIKLGLRQDYSHLTGNLSTVRGRILFGPHLKHNVAQAGKIFCLFNQRSSDTTENQALLAATEFLLLGQVCGPKTQNALRSCLRRMPAEISTSGFSNQKLSKIQIGRHNEHYRRPLFLAGLILRSIAFSNEAGTSHQPSFIINVAKLFEDYVAQCLLRYFDDPRLEILTQEKSEFDVKGTLHIQPDLMFRLRETNDIVSVADTKYKDLDSKSVNSADAYQMLAYMISRSCKVSVLIYPESMFRSATQNETITIRSSEGDYRIYVVTVPLTEPKDTVAAIKNVIQAVAMNQPYSVAAQK